MLGVGYREKALAVPWTAKKYTSRETAVLRCVSFSILILSDSSTGPTIGCRQCPYPVADFVYNAQ
jgi:hypothetical protein